MRISRLCRMIVSRKLSLNFSFFSVLPTRSALFSIPVIALTFRIVACFVWFGDLLIIHAPLQSPFLFALSKISVSLTFRVSERASGGEEKSGAEDISSPIASSSFFSLVRGRSNRRILPFDSSAEAFPKDDVYLNIAIANYVELEIVCGLGHAIGEWAKSGNSQTPLGTEEIHVGDDEPSQFTDLGEDGLMPTEWSDMHVMDDSTTTTKKPLLSSGIGSGSKRKSKTSAIDKDIRECIFLMADNVTEVANAIKSSITSPKQIRNMYIELIFELTNIPGFSDEDVDTIYDNLSKNPTLIASFLSKPKDSKARWMHKELRN
ncbi:hypothetical protein M5K25_002694 [Dendrobium thyrsiflorum]|uniref:Uncharacterized protein n=1 Tax=Dendrobium thyrsiflorum TaxID=117978 RepID=A0ABD0VN08_DENTH